MGIDIYEEKQAVMDNSSESTDSLVEAMDWEQLKAAVRDCQACPLHKTRTNPVFGVGNQQADLLIIGEAPGAQEDKQGEPFVGRAGQLLNEMLKSIGLERQDVYIANILKSRPPNNRDPQPEEVRACTPYLMRQIALLQPKIIMALGRIAAHFLLDTKTPLSRLRGQTFEFKTTEKAVPLIVTYHPAYLLRSPTEKYKAYKDLFRVFTSL